MKFKTEIRKLDEHLRRLKVLAEEAIRSYDETQEKCSTYGNLLSDLTRVEIKTLVKKWKDLKTSPDLDDDTLDNFKKELELQEILFKN